MQFFHRQTEMQANFLADSLLQTPDFKGVPVDFRPDFKNPFLANGWW